MSEDSALLSRQKFSVPCQSSGHPSDHCSIHPDDVPYRPNANQTKHHPSGRRSFFFRTSTVSRSYCSSLYSSGRLSNLSGCLSVIDQLQILSKFRIREDWYTHPDDVVSRPDARATNMEIADSTSTVWTNAYHGPDECIADMEITCWSSAVRMLIPHGPDARNLIRKLLAANLRPSGRQCLTVRTRLLNRKDFQGNSQKILSHCSPSKRRPYILQQSPILHLSL
jgi:hypothetical protein